MGGLSFLLKKGWHPNSLENQKAVYQAEQAAEDRRRREERAAEEIKKERDEVAREQRGELRRDPREADLKFMYAFPSKKSDAEEEEGQRELVVPGPGIHLAPGEEDEDVRKFRAKVEAAKSGEKKSAIRTEERETSTEEPKKQNRMREGNQSKDKELETLKRNSNFGHSSHFSKLEMEVGRKRKLGLTQDEQAERHPVLKNAPTEGAYTKGLQVSHKPFGVVVRNVQCFRCGEWGHASGDRQCPMSNHNPLERDRLHREDPLTFMNNTLRNMNPQHDDCNESTDINFRQNRYINDERKMKDGVVTEEGYDSEVGSSDPESEFLASLSSKEKVLLLRRLEMIEASGDDVASYAKRLQEKKSKNRNRSESESVSSSDESDRHKDRHHKHKKKRKHKKKDSKDSHHKRS